jgi:hypothetical protein
VLVYNQINSMEICQEVHKRELSYGEVLRCSFHLYQYKIVDLFLLFLIVGLANGAITAALGINNFLSASQNSLNPLDLFFRLIANLILLGILSWVLSTIANGVAIKYSSDLLEKREADLRKSFDFTLTRLVSLLGAGLVSTILIILGGICLIVPGIILAIMFSLVVPVIMIEGANALDSLGRSRKLVSKRWGKTFVVIILALLLQVIVTLLINTIISPFGSLSWIIASMANALVQPILPLVTVFLFYSMRIKEARQKEMTEKPTFFCPNCGRPVSFDDVYCRNCGKRIKEEKI